MDAQRGAALIARIDGLAVPHGQLALWSLGQAGFVIKGGSTIAYIDPYLSDSVAASGGSARRFPIPIGPGAIQHADVVFATHEHMDHADGATLGPLLAASPVQLLPAPQLVWLCRTLGIASASGHSAAEQRPALSHHGPSLPCPLSQPAS